MNALPQPIPPGVVLLYDGVCGFCRRWVPVFATIFRERNVAVAPLQNSHALRPEGVSESEWMENIRLVMPDGRHLLGMNVYRHLMSRIWWAWPVYVLSCLPGLRWVFDRAYRAFADNRFGISRVCRLG